MGKESNSGSGPADLSGTVKSCLRADGEGLGMGATNNGNTVYSRATKISSSFHSCEQQANEKGEKKKKKKKNRLCLTHRKISLIIYSNGEDIANRLLPYLLPSYGSDSKSDDIWDDSEMIIGVATWSPVVASVTVALTTRSSGLGGLDLCLRSTTPYTLTPSLAMISQKIHHPLH
jgi:hypothetical protein